jgi:hypothetical protein
MPLTTFVSPLFQLNPPIASTPEHEGLGANCPSQLSKTILFMPRA